MERFLITAICLISFALVAGQQACIAFPDYYSPFYTYKIILNTDNRTECCNHCSAGKTFFTRFLDVVV